MHQPGRYLSTAWAVAALTLWAALPLTAAEPPKLPPRPRVVATATGPDAALLERHKAGAAWQAVKHGAALPSGSLLVGLPGGALDSRKDAVHLSFHSDINQLSPYPIFEAAVVLHPARDVDLDFTLDRGRVDVVNNKKKGQAKVRIHFHGQVWEAILEKPGTRVGLELYGRWAPGTQFTTKPSPTEMPSASLLLLVLKGEVSLQHGGARHLLRAPPGPALIQWNNVDGGDLSPQRLDKLPPWADATRPVGDRAKKIKGLLEEFRQAILARGLPEAIREFLASDERLRRGIALVYLGATDNLEGLGKVLTGAKRYETWDFAVTVVRHWLGRCACQDQVIYDMLVHKRKMSPNHAATILQLLRSFGETDLARPETYQMLVRYLSHPLLGIRGLAYWHLYRLVPAGRKFGYNPTEPAEARKRAIAKWRKLIPRGKMPPRPTADDPPGVGPDGRK